MRKAFLMISISLLLSLMVGCMVFATTGDAIHSGMYGFEAVASAETAVYTITYHLDGGTNAPKNPGEYTAEDTIVLKDATKTGYNFAGWFLDAQKTMQISTISNRTGNLNLYAKFIPKSYTATFNDNGATKSTDITITLNNSIGTTKKYIINNNDTFDPYAYWIPTRTDYVFAGWYCGTELISGSYEVTTDLALTAKWVKCVQNGKERPSPIVLGGTITIDSNDDYSADLYGVYNSSYIFYAETSESRWYGDAYLAYDYSNYYANGGWSYLYVYVSGKYTTINYEAECGDYYGDGGKTGYCEIYDVTNQRELVEFPPSYFDWDTYSGSFEVKPGTLLRIGVGYSMTAGYDAEWGKLKLSLGEIRTSQIYPANERTVEHEFDSYINAPSVSKTGYDCIGWYDENGNEMTDTWQYLQDKTFTAKWQPTKYYITYNLNGGTNSLSNPSSYTIEDTITLRNPSKAGYTFKGWYSDANFTKQVTSISNSTGNITLYAKFTANSYKLTLDGNEGVWAPKVTFVSDGEIVKSCYLYGQDSITAYRPEPKEGYIFAGWYEDSAFNTLFEFDGTITDDITLYAKWIECDSNTINVETVDAFDVNIQGKMEQLYAFVPLTDGKITITSQSDNLDLYGILYDTSKNILISADDISESNLDFSFTYSVTAGQLYYIAVKGNTTITSGSATINVGWTGSCTITGTTYQNRQSVVVYGYDYKLPLKPIRDGYVFLGWFDENGNQVVDGVWNFTADKTLTAKWEEATYHTVVFKDANGDIISSETYYLSEDIIAPEFPTKATDHIGSYYAKWDNNYTGVCTGDAVYTVVFEVKEYIDYTIIFKDWNGDIISEQTYHYGDMVVAPDTPTKEADNTYIYTFAGWDNEIVTCVTDTIYTATYDQTYIDYTIIFEDEDGTILSTSTYHYGDTVTIPEAPTKVADNICTYEFAGWDNEVVACEGDATYTATYSNTYIDYTIVFKDYDGATINSKDYHYGDAITIPADPTREADSTYTYEFAGWDTDVALTCDGSAVYTATYVSIYIDYTIIFKDYDDTIISSKTYHYGDEIDVPSDPIRKADMIGTYTFNSWDKEVIACESDATYTATYIVTYIEYNIVFRDSLSEEIYKEEKLVYGSVIVPPEAPTKQDVVFDGWAGYSDGMIVTGDVIFTANWHTHTKANVVENNVEPNCTEDGSYDNVVYCIVCEAELSRETVVVDALGHDEITHEAQAPTCTAIGWDEYVTCSCCNYTTYVEIPATGHNYSLSLSESTCRGMVFVCSSGDDVLTVDPDRYDNGIIYCEFLGEYYELGEEIHNYATEWTVWNEPTCTKAGLEVCECLMCPYMKSRTIDSLGHSEGEIIVENNVLPTCTKTGSYDNVVYCLVCEEELGRETVVVDALGHDEEHHEAQAPTCTAIGWDEYVTCLRCDYTTYQEISATGHDEGAVVVENRVEPNCTEDGSYDNVVYCTVCKVELRRDTVEVSAIGHTEGEWIIDSNPTCTQAGSKHQICATCSETIRTSAISVTSHTNGSWITDVPATCTTDGFKHQICATCGVTIKTDSITATGHTEGEWITDLQATCTIAGSKHQVCATCGVTINTSSIPATGHNLGEWAVSKAPTCTEAGEERRDCNNCDYYETREHAALGHDYSDGGKCALCGKLSDGTVTGVAAGSSVAGASAIGFSILGVFLKKKRLKIRLKE